MVDKEEEEQTEPEKPAEEVLTGEAAVEEEEIEEEEEEEKTAKEIAIPPDTIQMPQAAVPGKKFPWKIVLILAVVVVGVVLVVGFWPKDDGQARDDGAGATAVAFLSVHTNKPAKVTLDGELLTGGTPVKDKVLRAGTHRVRVDSLDGTRLMDEVIVLVAGEHKDIRVVIAAAPHPAEPPADVKPTGKKIRKKKKKRVRRKRRRTRK